MKKGAPMSMGALVFFLIHPRGVSQNYPLILESM